MRSAETLCNCLALRRATRHLTQRYDAALAPAGLRVTQYSVLAHLHRLGTSTVQGLAEELVMDRSTLGHNLRPLERDGLVALAINPDDRRARCLTLTEAGREKLSEARPLWKKAQADFEAAYGTDRAQHLRELLQQVVAEVDPAS